MPLDANGIWQYVETETAAPVSTMLNRLAGSVSTIVAPIVNDTGWVSIPTSLPAPWIGSMKARRIGSEVRWKGSVDPVSTTWGAINNPQTLVDLTTNPAWAVFIPVDTMPFLLSANTANSSAVVFRATIQSNGLVVARNNQTNYAFGVNVVCDYYVN
jgi:hypothetical protein